MPAVRGGPLRVTVEVGAQQQGAQGTVPEGADATDSRNREGLAGMRGWDWAALPKP